MKTKRTLVPVPLTAERFAPFGDVISTGGAGNEPMNEARFARYSDLGAVDVDGRAAIGIVQSRSPTALPYVIEMVERHPLGSQAFIPLSAFSFVVVVAPPGESVNVDDLQAFATNGSQGINYHRGTWHMPLIAQDEGQRFLVVDRAPGDGNCEEWIFEEAVVLNPPG